jgi:hypothetical protein
LPDPASPGTHKFLAKKVGKLEVRFDSHGLHQLSDSRHHHWFMLLPICQSTRQSRLSQALPSNRTLASVAATSPRIAAHYLVVQSFFHKSFWPDGIRDYPGMPFTPQRADSKYFMGFRLDRLTLPDHPPAGQPGHCQPATGLPRRLTPLIITPDTITTTHPITLNQRNVISVPNRVAKIAASPSRTP